MIQREEIIDGGPLIVRSPNNSRQPDIIINTGSHKQEQHGEQGEDGAAAGSPFRNSPEARMFMERVTDRIRQQLAGKLEIPGDDFALCIGEFQRKSFRPPQYSDLYTAMAESGLRRDWQRGLFLKMDDPCVSGNMMVTQIRDNGQGKVILGPDEKIQDVFGDAAHFTYLGCGNPDEERVKEQVQENLKSWFKQVASPFR